MRIKKKKNNLQENKKNINLGIISRSNAKFSELT